MACHLLSLERAFTTPPQKTVVSGTWWSRRHLSNCATLLLFRPRHTNENATRHQTKTAKRFQKGKAAATFCQEEVDASGGQSTNKERGGGATGGNAKAVRGDGDGADDRYPEGGDNESESEVLEDKQKRTLLDCLRQRRAKNGKKQTGGMATTGI